MVKFEEFIKEIVKGMIDNFENNFYLTNNNKLINNVINLNIDKLVKSYKKTYNISKEEKIIYNFNDLDFENLFNNLIKNSKIEFEEINFYNLKLNDYSLFLISEFIKTNIKINKLELGLNNFKEDGLLCFFENLKLNNKINSISLKGIKMSDKIIHRLYENFLLNDNIESIDVGIVGNLFLDELIWNLNKIKCKYLTIEEDITNPWMNDTKNNLIEQLKKCNKSILSINIDSIEIYKHEDFIGNISVILERTRDEKEIEIYKKYQQEITLKKTNELEILNLPKIMENFSNRKYIDNIFESIIEESLFLIEREQKNKIRSEKKFTKTGIKDNNENDNYDIFTVEGCSYKLALYLMNYLKNI